MGASFGTHKNCNKSRAEKNDRTQFRRLVYNWLKGNSGTLTGRQKAGAIPSYAVIKITCAGPPGQVELCDATA